MDLPTIDREGAAEAAARYASIRVPTAEETAITAGFLALAAGKQLINLPEVLAAGGEFDNGMPRLAVMAPTRAWCYAYRDPTGRVVYSGSPTIDDRAVHAVFRFPALLAPRADLSHEVRTSWRLALRSQVPLVPPQHRVRGWKGKCRILWEVEEWAKEPRPPGDPALIRRLSGDLWTVEAVWDLTELERAVLGHRE